MQKRRPSHLLTHAARASLMALCLTAGQAHALGLGRLNVQSALGETLKAEIELTSLSAEEAATLRVRVAAPDAFRAQGLEYNAVLSGAQVQLVRQPDGRSVLRVQSERAVQEPFLDLLLDIRWSTGRLSREFTLLFDPPSTQAPSAPRAAEVISSPVVSAPVVAAPPQLRPLAPAPAAPVAAAPREPREPRAPRELPTDGSLTVRTGDSLSRLADRNRPGGVSLDQMLVALYRENPDAFINGNMNLLKAGQRLRLPARDLINAVPADEARRLVRTHSNDFEAVRQGLASAAPKLPAQSERSAAGVVQPKVAETKPAAPAGDRLTLSKPAIPPATTPPAAVPPAKEAAMARDVADLKKLAEAAKQQVAPAASAPVAPVAPLVAAASAAASALATAPVPLPEASAPPVVAAAPASVVVPPPAAPAPTAAPVASSSVMDTLLSPIGAAGVALLALGGAFAARFVRRRKSGPAQETLFGESRLQPDSFFGVTGGQRVDTRDGASGVSSMSYSLSQLDAHGDVDPVAEADVYLAYGRDLQAEEILKEALRAQPERLAIRLKLMEVYAKRRDVRGFEQLATRLYADTKGQGEDWEKAQEMGLSIDPENHLYQPGGAPRSMFDEDSPRPEPTNATTLPQAGPLSLQMAEAAEAARQGTPSLIDLDLDLDIGTPAAPAAPAMQKMQPLPAIEAAASELDMDLDISEPMPLDGVKDNSMEFELSDLAELGGGTVSPGLAADSTQRMSLRTEIQDLDESPTTKVGGDSLMDAMQDMGGDDADPMMRQLELAEEFRQIGDVEGARDVLQELLSQLNSGPLYERAKKLMEEIR